MSCFNFEVHAGSRDGCGHEQALEAYADAVRLYQDAVLDLQNARSLDPASLGSVLEKAEAAKAVVNSYRGAHQQISQVPGLPF